MRNNQDFVPILARTGNDHAIEGNRGSVPAMG
jgi:hypothetical protein